MNQENEWGQVKRKTGQFREVLLTASMSEVFLRLGDSVLSGNSALRQSHAKGVVIQIGHASTLSESQPAAAIKAASQLNLHVPFAFPWPKGQVRKGLLVQFKSHTHKNCLSFIILTGIAAIASSLTNKEGKTDNLTPCRCAKTSKTANAFRFDISRPAV